jgi:CheY-like chemotaxis protein
MEINCESCGTRLNIPEKKIPEGQVVTASCPKCKNKLTFEKPKQASDSRPAPDENETMSAEQASAYDYGEDDSNLEIFEEGTKLAIVMENRPELIEKMKKAVKSLGFQFVSAANTREAVSKMRLHHFDLAILSDRFDDVELSQSPILHYLNRLSMSFRRKMFVTLVGEGFKTMDGMMAFAMSSNLVVNLKDLDKLGSILKRTLGENQKFYKIFMDTSVELGKA